jgi:hypothetical protein
MLSSSNCSRDPSDNEVDSDSDIESESESESGSVIPPSENLVKQSILKRGKYYTWSKKDVLIISKYFRNEVEGAIHLNRKIIAKNVTNQATMYQIYAIAVKTKMHKQSKVDLQKQHKEN